MGILCAVIFFFFFFLDSSVYEQEIFIDFRITAIHN
jgi:hypothetical protein